LSKNNKLNKNKHIIFFVKKFTYIKNKIDNINKIQILSNFILRINFIKLS